MNCPTALNAPYRRKLTGRTKDQNVGYIAEYLTAFGIDLKEVLVVGDEERAIDDALRAQHELVRDAQKLAQALERVRRAHGENRVRVP